MKMKVLLLTTMILLGLATAGAEASGLFGEGAMTPDAGQFVHSRSGSIITTGRLGSLQTTTLPTGAGVGVLMNNGNGTSTVFGSNGTIATLPTP
jgi:hypothetical protein